MTQEKSLQIEVEELVTKTNDELTKWNGYIGHTLRGEIAVNDIYKKFFDDVKNLTGEYFSKINSDPS